MRIRETKFHKVTPSANTIGATAEALIASPMTDRVRVRISHTHATDTLYIFPSPASDAIVDCTTANGIPIPPAQERIFNWGTDYHISAIRGAAADISARVIEEAD